MGTISTGIVVGIMLNVLISVLYLGLPLPWAWKMAALFKYKPNEQSQYVRLEHFKAGISAWYVWVLHVSLVLMMYSFLGMAWTAHITVIAFELTWHFITTGLLVSYGRRHIDASLA